ncbi:hypothetical protein RCL1_004216 [Eukaryota sp. TZLM3-RCL]
MAVQRQNITRLYPGVHEGPHIYVVTEVAEMVYLPKNATSVLNLILSDGNNLCEAACFDSAVQQQLFRDGLQPGVKIILSNYGCKVPTGQPEGTHPIQILLGSLSQHQILIDRVQPKKVVSKLCLVPVKVSYNPSNISNDVSNHIPTIRNKRNRKLSRT